jgi:lipopolysaccharide/colanic/teichoic acid biosynthesis glycosyltransferase
MAYLFFTFKKEFGMIKLRTMRRDAEEQLAIWRQKDSLEWRTYCANNFKLEHDPRLLKIGAFLRRMSIDELPQLINVLKGQMSLVGPRPILSREIEDYGKTISLYTSTKPGMTGLWQVSGRSKTSFVQRATLDGWYIRNWSLGYDIVILLRTIGVVLRSAGAY